MTAAPAQHADDPRVTYLDASALVKLVIVESETDSLRTWLEQRPESPRLTSDVARVEVTRAVGRVTPGSLLVAQAVVARTRKVLVSADLLDAAATIPPPTIRSLDAIHLASAMVLRPRLGAFVAYDKRLLAAAEDLGLPVAHPGMA